MLFTDTDSLIHENKTKDVYEDFSYNQKVIDCRKYDKGIDTFLDFL